MAYLTAFWSKIRSFVGRIDERLERDYVLIPIDGSPLPSPRRLASRHWTASATDEQEAFNIGHQAVLRFAQIPPIWSSASMNEATTRSAIIDPVLDVMGWRPWRCEVPLKEGGKVDYYHDSTRVAIEAKSANPLYDDLAALNPTSAYRNNLEQAVSYLDSTDVWATIFTNARFWWRIERDSASRRLYALRFDLNFAQNVLRNRGAYKPLEHFASFFHANAFRIGANLVLPVHPGRRVNYGPEETVMVKDLNKGLGPSTLDE
jgi:hypothetical protein